MQPNQNTAGTPNQNAATAPGQSVAGGAAPTPGVAGVSAAAGVAGRPASAVAGAPANTTAPVAKKETAPEQNIMAVGVSAKKKGKGMIYGLVLLALLAAGGIGFGVWTMMDGNTQKEQLNSQISALKTQNNELSEKLSNASGATEEPVVVSTNPVIRSSESGKDYRVWLTSSVVGEKKMSIGVKDGKVDICDISNVDGSSVGNCAIDGITGDIFDVVEFGEGQDNLYSNIGFIMTDGTVLYFPLIEAMENNSFAIKGKLNIDGFVTNAVEITVGPTDPNARGGYGSTVFVLSDGSFVKYNESMLQ